MAKILVMDDEIFIRDMMGDVLRFCGYDVTLVEEGQAAIDLLLESNYDLCILDVSVPHGLGAVDTLFEMNKKGLCVKSVLSTGYSDIDLVKNFKHHGFCGCLTKPFDLDTIKQEIDGFLDLD
ncbi:MAG: response regulator [Candidatus Cloacimonetes bacterium]|nr:response regulator [Candidatus Cloacimonadota bacterium]